MPLNIWNNKNINIDTVNKEFIKNFIKTGDYVYSNSKFGTSNKVDRFDYVRNNHLYSLLNKHLGIGNCDNSCVNIYEKNNAWFDCCNINEKGLCFDGENFRDLTKEKEIIEEYKKSNWKYIKTENCTLHFERSILPIDNTTDIHAYFDSSSMLIEDAVTAKEALISWFDSILLEHPYYEGNLYIICIANGVLDPNIEYADVSNPGERWLRQAKYSYEGTKAIASIGGWGAISELPPNYDDPPNYTPPENIIILSFSDETEAGVISDACPTAGSCGYHGVAFPSFGTGTAGNPIQPTLAYNTDLTTFLSYRYNYTTYKQLLYPIKRDGNVFSANVLQMIAAVKARLLSSSEISDLNASIDASILETQNPYSIALEEYNVDGIWDKTSPASEVFSSDTFGSELTDALNIKSPIIQKTTAELPIKYLEPPIYGYQHSWELLDKEYKRCAKTIPFDEILVKLHKFAIK